jgi:folate-dependent phosphoribosylglycinamide formyltransferase PurN
VELVVSDRPAAGALARARDAAEAALVIPVSGRDAQEVETETLTGLRDRGIQAIVLAGYLRLLPAGVVRAFPRRILNIHPALLPAFGGKGMYGRRIHEAVLASGARVSGVTIHYVDEAYDTGSILAQWPVPVLADDTPESLAARVLAVEHFLYPHATDHVMRAVAEDRDAGPFQPPGSVFTLAQDAPEAELARQIRGAFRRR